MYIYIYICMQRKLEALHRILHHYMTIMYRCTFPWEHTSKTWQPKLMDPYHPCVVDVSACEDHAYLQTWMVWVVNTLQLTCSEKVIQQWCILAPDQVLVKLLCADHSKTAEHIIHIHILIHIKSPASSSLNCHHNHHDEQQQS